MARWVELRAVVARTRFDALSQIAFAAGATGTEEAPAPGARPVYKQPWDTEAPPLPLRVTLKAWFSEDEADAGRTALEGAGAEIEALVVDDEDWAESWKAFHKRIEVSPRLRVAPPWEALPGDLVIPPGNAFGTGGHPTTLACLGAIDRLAGECTSVLDVGCGSGVLALAAAQRGLKATGIDIDPDAVTSSRSNAALNTLSAEFSTLPLQRVSGTYDLVVANVFAEVLTMLAPDLLRVTSRHLVLAGILAERAGPVLDALSPPLAIREEIREGDWLHLHLERL